MENMESISIGIDGHPRNNVELYDVKVLTWGSIIQKITEFSFWKFMVLGCFTVLCNFCSTYRSSIRVGAN